MFSHLKHIPSLKLIVLLGDFVFIGIAFLLVVHGRPFPNSVVYFISPSIMIGALISTAYILNVYDPIFDPLNKTYIKRFIVTILFATIMIVLLTKVILQINVMLDRWFILVISLVGGGLYTWRIICHKFFLFNRLKPALIVGAGEAGQRLYKELFVGQTRFVLIGYVDDDPFLYGKETCGVNVLGGSDALDDIIKENKINDIVLAITREKSPKLLQKLLDCSLNGVHVYNNAEFYELFAGKVPVEALEDLWFVYTPLYGLRSSFYNNDIKRFIDIALSFLGLIISLPLCLAIALAIKLDSHGEVFYHQRRVGKNEQVFELIKFRSMRADAEKNGAVWADEEDLRITRVGRWIRKWRLDEIPQMWNVLRGDMSLVGPRPERPEFVSQLEKLIPYYQIRHAIKPGITGWAQVNYKYGASVNDALEKLRYELFYMKNMSGLLDLHILLLTVRVMLFGQGAR